MQQTTVALVLVGALGCGAEDPDTSSTAGITFEEFQSRVAREPGTGAYVVDWDRRIYSDAELLEFFQGFQNGALSIRTAGGIDVKWSAAQQRALTYCISNGFGANKATVVEAMKQATDEGWEKLANVDFIYLPAQDATCTAQNMAVMFDVIPVTDAPYAASAFFPDEPREIRNVSLDVLDVFENDPAVPLKGLLSHELGHTLGFPHEHTRPEAQNQNPDCTSTRPLRALTSYDSASVMHYLKCNGTATTLAFTQRDGDGAALVYGAPVNNVSPMTQLTAPANGAILGPSFMVEVEVVDQDLAKVELLLDETLQKTKLAGPFQFPMTDVAEGPHTLSIVATDSIGQVDTQTIAITVVAADDGDGDGDDEDSDPSTGCAAGGGLAGLAFVGLLVLGLLLRRTTPGGT